MTNVMTIVITIIVTIVNSLFLFLLMVGKTLMGTAAGSVMQLYCRRGRLLHPGLAQPQHFPALDLVHMTTPADHEVVLIVLLVRVHFVPLPLPHPYPGHIHSLLQVQSALVRVPALPEDGHEVHQIQFVGEDVRSDEHGQLPHFPHHLFLVSLGNLDARHPLLLPTHQHKATLAIDEAAHGRFDQFPAPLTEGVAHPHHLHLL